jgi:hypothetical protein
MQAKRLIPLFLILFFCKNFVLISQTSPRRPYTCEELKRLIDQDRKTIQKRRIEINNCVDKRKIIAKESQINILQQRKREYQETYKIMGCGSANNSSKYKNTEAKKKEYTSKEILNKNEKLKSKEAKINENNTAIRNKNVSGQRLTAEESKQLKSSNKDNESLRKIENDAVAKSNKLAAKKENNKVNNSQAAAIREWKNELKKKGSHQLEYTLKNKILINQFDLLYDIPALDFYRMVYLKPSKSWNLLFIKNNYFLLTSKRYIFPEEDMFKQKLFLELNSSIVNYESNKRKLFDDINAKRTKNANKEDELNKLNNKLNSLYERRKIEFPRYDATEKLIKLIDYSKFKSNPDIIRRIESLKKEVELKLWLPYTKFTKDMDRMSKNTNAIR